MGPLTAELQNERFNLMFPSPNEFDINGNGDATNFMQIYDQKPMKSMQHRAAYMHIMATLIKNNMTSQAEGFYEMLKSAFFSKTIITIWPAIHKKSGKWRQEVK
jgi:hypothetical protein